jgi:choline dehydrogenase
VTTTASAATETVDYCIVGGGPAGCVLASRLSEDARNGVMLLEAGPRDWHPFLHIPAGFIFAYRDRRFNWLYQSEPDPGLCNRTLGITQGKVLGGSSSINGMLHARGQKQEIDRWSREGCTGWGYDELLPYYLKAETYKGSARSAEARRGTDGPQVVSDPLVIHPLSRAFVEGARQIGMPYVEDMNGAHREGVAHYQQNRDGRFRSQPAQTYLRSARKRPNLRVEVHATCTKVLFEGRRATGVQYVQAGQSRTVMVRREVIVSAGVFKSPQLLQLSGIGDPEALRALGIPTLVASRGVGRNLRDHFLLSVIQRVQGTPTLNERTHGPTLVREVMKYAFRGTGLLTMGTAAAAATFRSRPDLEAADALLMFTPGSYATPGVLDSKPGMTIGLWPAHPKSHGTVAARSTNPLDPPSIRLNFLSDEDDQRVVVECVRRARAIFASPAMSPYTVMELNPGPDVRSNDEIADFARQQGRSGMHFVGTCRMGSDDAAVVDTDLRVKGVAGLRVVDASVMPNTTVGNINATVVAIAERAADLIASAARDET